MKSWEATSTRWDRLFGENAVAVDWRQATIAGQDSPCDDGLRSVCWKAFLLFGPLSQSTWPKKLNESRSAYASLREHFMKYINNPNDLQSNVDPLSDDSSSPWSSLRSDETGREEIFQDVQRCMQDNFFFRDPIVQKRMLDILFIYSKLNPDLGYRQGMHELLAPILWVVDSDAMDTTIMPKQKNRQDDKFMGLVLDREYVEHDSFSLFCAVMQTAKMFYEPGDKSGTSALNSRCAVIQESLGLVDPDLADHLQVIGILPQVFLIRWIRLLFGRDFDFAGILELWDVLFASNISLETIDAVCLIMLLHVRWGLIEADYSTALNILLRYRLPPSAGKTRDLAQSAIRLQKSLSPETGSILIKEFSGRQPGFSSSHNMQKPLPTPPRPADRKTQTPARQNTQYARDTSQSEPFPSPSGSRLFPQQQNLESIISHVSSGLHRKADSWNVSKAVLGAADEVRRNLQNLYSNPSPRRSMDSEEPVLPNIGASGGAQTKIQELTDRIHELEARNKALAKMVDNVISSLRQDSYTGVTTDQNPTSDTGTNINIALAKLQFVSVYLSDAEIRVAPTEATAAPEVLTEGDNENKDRSHGRGNHTSSSEVPTIEEPPPLPLRAEEPRRSSESPDQTRDSSEAEKPKLPGRPSLADSSFSFMLGENRHRSSFVSSVADLPQETRRGSDASSRPTGVKLSTETERSKEKRPSIQIKDDDGFTMQSFLGRR